VKRKSPMGSPNSTILSSRSGGSWDSFGGDGSRPGKLQSQHIAEEFWKTPPKSIIAAYASASRRSA
jgi:hypothetical protein